MPLTLYHGTRGDVLESVFREGLKPRGNGVGNWPGIPSRLDRVYFASGPPIAYATDKQRKGPGWIFEVNFGDEILHSGDLGPDEDSVGSSIGRKEGWWNPNNITLESLLRMQALVATINIEQYSHKWAEWLERTGGTSFKGTVPPGNITRYARLEVAAVPELISIWADFCMRQWPGDPTTGTVLPQYAAKVRRVFDSMTRTLMYGEPLEVLEDLYPPDFPKRKQRVDALQRQLTAGVRRFAVSS